MLLSGRSTRRVVAIGAGVIIGAMLFGGIPSAVADDPPPNCTAADLAGTAASVSAATSVYLFDHPDVNDFFTSLKGRPKSQIHDDVRNYLNANPQTKADLQGIRQPIVDLKNRCQ